MPSDDQAPTDDEALLQRYELEHDAKVVRTSDTLHSYTLDQPGPEVIGSGTIGPTGVARWQPPIRAGSFLVFYANQSRPDGTADFTCVRMNVQTGESSAEIVDKGWYEIAFNFAAAPELLKK